MTLMRMKVAARIKDDWNQEKVFLRDIFPGQKLVVPDYYRNFNYNNS